MMKWSSDHGHTARTTRDGERRHETGACALGVQLYVISLPLLQTGFDYVTLKSECVYPHKTYKACYKTHLYSQVIIFAKSLIQ